MRGWPRETEGFARHHACVNGMGPIPRAQGFSLDPFKPSASWKARLDLSFQRRGQTCSTDTHEGPLRVLQALYSDGLGITKSDLLVIDKIDLAPHVGADLDIMRQDTARMRPDAQRRPWVMRNLKTREGLQEVVDCIVTRGMLAAN